MCLLSLADQGLGIMKRTILVALLGLTVSTGGRPVAVAFNQRRSQTPSDFGPWASPSLRVGRNAGGTPVPRQSLAQALVLNAIGPAGCGSPGKRKRHCRRRARAAARTGPASNWSEHYRLTLVDALRSR